jgi:hypothetical protein
MPNVKWAGRPEADAFQVHQVMSGGHLMDMYAEAEESRWKILLT